MSRIGIPRTLAYFIYFPFWKTFFEELDQEVVLSSPTTREIMDHGVREAVNDACIPIKLYHGHVADLASKVDYVFCPRLVSVRKHGDFGTETFCPKFLGLPDMVRLAMDNLPEIIDVRVDLKQGKDELLNVCSQVGDLLGKSEVEIKKAYQSAMKVQKRFKKLLYQNMTPEEALDMLFAKGERKPLLTQPDLQIAVVGYPYVIYDDYINGRILSLLAKENVNVYTQDMLSDKIMNRQARNLPKSMFWYFSNRAVYGALHFMQQKNIDGIIHITAFACGPDSIVDRLLEIEARRHGQIPYLSIAVDEHTGDAGVRTRVEAFLDMLRFRREKS
ncbi:MAG: acyl-CoA dehydratase activase-related protein [Syntrophomonadaceae bacterium]|nr:acyl-CoA dehydratase activase-related protein [Syntrophomonadaceae bacterium]MDD3271462.1 acyl-CoA dehydratase activase-related protein [Syntrophomonadaceae bacterium]MDD4562136.1 acyl-CoA dehydratase activase-related protein [Syntrophomonadaceae bacterium]